MLYINYRCPDSKLVETIEDISNLPRKEWISLVAEYQKISFNYYASVRASKQFYNDKKANK